MKVKSMPVSVTVVRILVALVLLGVPGRVREARAGVAPDSAQLPALEDRVERAGRVRVQTSRALLEHVLVTVEPGGLVIHEPIERPAVWGTSVSPPQPRLVAWNDVERIDATRSNAGRGFIIGALTGVALTGAAAAANGGFDLFELGDRGLIGLGLMFSLCTGATGSLVGAMVPHRERLYP